jgi:hypothetical protein
VIGPFGANDEFLSHLVQYQHGSFIRYSLRQLLITTSQFTQTNWVVL